MDQWINSGSVDPQNGRISLIRQGMTEYPKMQNAFLYKKKSLKKWNCNGNNKII